LAGGHDGAGEGIGATYRRLYTWRTYRFTEDECVEVVVRLAGVELFTFGLLTVGSKLGLCVVAFGAGVAAVA